MTLQYYTAQNSLMVVCLILSRLGPSTLCSFLLIMTTNYADPGGRGSAAARLLGLPFRISPGAWRFVSCDCRLLSGRGLWDEPITRPEEFYRLRCVVVCDLEI
jgi:hypothetical protein